jgi:hypothetical protein
MTLKVWTRWEGGKIWHILANLNLIAICKFHFRSMKPCLRRRTVWPGNLYWIGGKCARLICQSWPNLHAGLWPCRPLRQIASANLVGLGVSIASCGWGWVLVHCGKILSWVYIDYCRAFSISELKVNGYRGLHFYQYSLLTSYYLHSNLYVFVYLFIIKSHNS